VNDPNKNSRPPITLQNIELSKKELSEKLLYRLQEKGIGSFASRHEILGILEEEMHELNDAIKSGNISDVKQELLDIAVGALFAVACINENTLDW